MSKHHNIDEFSLALRDALLGYGIILIVARNKTELEQIAHSVLSIFEPLVMQRG